MDRGAWQSPRGLKESDTTERPALAQGVQQPVRGLLCPQCSGPWVLGQMDGNPSSKSLGLTPSARCERWFRCSLRFLLAWIFSFFFFFSYLPTGELRGDYFHDKEIFHVFFFFTGSPPRTASWLFAKWQSGLPQEGVAGRGQQRVDSACQRSIRNKVFLNWYYKSGGGV